MINIDCPDGSSIDSDLSFVVAKSDNGTILGNWTIDSTENISSESNGFNQGPIYRGNLPVFAPILWSDSVGKM